MNKGGQEIRFAYPGATKRSGYAVSSNTYQKMRMVADCLHGKIVVPRGSLADMWDELKGTTVEAKAKCRGVFYFWGLVREFRKDVDAWCFPAAGFGSLLGIALVRVLSRTRYVLFCWDPPGMSRRNKNDLLNRFVCWSLDRLLSFAVAGSRGLILNLHPDFLEGRMNVTCLKKVYSFPNGTNLQDVAEFEDIKKVPHRIAVSSYIVADKGCWETVDTFLAVRKKYPDASIVWIGDGAEYDAVRKRFQDEGVLPVSVVMPGRLPHDEAVKLLATGSVALSLYRDVPSLRWNYVLKVPEALAMGQPVVSSATPGASFYLQAEGVGTVCAAKDAARSVMDWFGRMVENAEEKRQACRIAAQTYQWTTINDSIAAAVRSLIV